MGQNTQCVVVGGGPAGIVLGLLLARAGVQVTVLEKHADFLRDFRGDTVHASTLRLLDELGLGEGFRQLPQSRMDNFTLPAGSGEFVLADFGLLKEPYNYVAMVPQWDLLNFLVAAAKEEPCFTLIMNAEATDLLTESSGKVSGVRYRIKDPITGGTLETNELHAPLTVACDGRGSVLRSKAGLAPKEFPVPFDTWWFRLSRDPEEIERVASISPRFGDSDVLLSLTRKDYHQIAYLAAKGSDQQLRAKGVDAFRSRIARLRPDLADRVGEIQSMDELHLLDVKLNRLSSWHKPGLLLIGDAAHAMSPAGGVGINLAVQDAVAAARILAPVLLDSSLKDQHLAAVQKRRWLPTVIVQTFQRLMHRAIFTQVMAGKQPEPPKVLVLLSQRFPRFRRIPARMMAFGPLPEHAPGFARRKPGA